MANREIIEPRLIF